MRLDSVWADIDRAGGDGGSALDRLRQYRRDECFAHRAQGPCRADAFSRSGEGRGRRSHRRLSCRARRLPPETAWPPPPVLAAAMGAFLGHVYPVWLGFRGGKGVATFLGCLLIVAWPAGLAFIAVWLGAAIITRLSSLAALLASALSPAFLFALDQTSSAIVFALMAVLLWIKHAPNIARLRAGNETRIGKS
ncbi:membrane protein of unknown function [Methylocella tundrae]|uniref:Uncharacterized protein n=1 Tax=Methylocella tundrae TaxID=227605 RepID=A0A4U8Z696_METTU|nr:membrane protein of unknown function [Methylocella tundrae]